MEPFNDIKKITGLLGYPIENSRSPELHNKAFAKAGLPYEYRLFAVKPKDFEKKIKELKKAEVVGFNVTAPYKKRIIPYIDKMSAAAEAVGAVNTVVNRDGSWYGYNTDGKGFICALLEKGFKPADKSVVVLGAGGGAAAIAYELAKENRVVILNRTISKAVTLAERISRNLPESSGQVIAEELNIENIKHFAASADLVINATPIGSYERAGETLIDSKSSVFRQGMLAVDLIYDPEETVFLKVAGEAAAETMNGSRMLYHQGAAAWELWTGQKFPQQEQVSETDIAAALQVSETSERRKSRGEYYTPAALADWTLKKIFEFKFRKPFKDCSNEEIKKTICFDPTCGDGIFLTKAIQLKKKAGGTLQEILDTVKGIEINPEVVKAAKENYIKALSDATDDGQNIWDVKENLNPKELLEKIPVYCADILSASEKIRREIGKADILMGNPPWVNWQNIPSDYKKEIKEQWNDYKLFDAKGPELAFSKEDISTIVTYVAIDKYLKTGGAVGLVIRQGIFKSQKNGAAFRKFCIKDRVYVGVKEVDDLSSIKVFKNASANTAVFFAVKGEKTGYPVPYFVWNRSGQKKELAACPAVSDNPQSIWMTVEPGRREKLKKILGTNSFRARTGVFTGGANGVYHFNINKEDGQCVNVTNVTRRAKRKVPVVTQDIEKNYIYPMLKGGNIKMWKTKYDTYILCPHTAETKNRPVLFKDLERNAPKTAAYLENFKDILDERKGFAGWEKQIQKDHFHSILRVGPYTFSDYKVVWRYIAKEFICAVVGPTEDPFLGKTTILPNEKVMYVSFDSPKEAYYFCGILSSEQVSSCIKGYMSPMSISTHILNKLNIPDFDEENSLHLEISKVCYQGHNTENIDESLYRLNRLVEKLYP